MAGLKEIRRRLKSVNNTKKITYAMKLVSAAKLRKTQEAVVRSRAYSDALLAVLGEIVGRQQGQEFSHPLMEKRLTVRKIHLLILGGARGLCGAYNTNINRKVEIFYREKMAEHPGATITTTILGKKPAEYYRRVGKNYSEAIEVLPDDPQAWPTDDVSKKIELGFLTEDYDEVYILFTRFKSAISMTATLERLLPLESTQSLVADKQETKSGMDSLTLFEPSANAVFAALIPRLIRSRIRQAALDSKASEHASRMTAMDAATKNASELMHSLTLTRNRLRQSGITSQLLDIVGGAEALRG